MVSKINQITRYGAYGIVLTDLKLLLTQKRGGPFKGLWDLPGGGIEFNETPEEALKRELIEETALAAEGFEFFSIKTFNGEYDNEEGRYAFHHIGIIYKVANTTPVSGFVPAEDARWFIPHEISLDQLTPFAKYVVEELVKGPGTFHKSAMSMIR